MEIVIFFASIGSVLFLLIAVFELPHVNKLEKQVKESFEVLPFNTSLNEIAPVIGYSFPDVVPQTLTTIHLGRRPQRLTVHVPSCPDCGRYLVARDGKYGKFWGCTGYPNCHFTRKYS
mgnify:CR=1 FL=1